MNKQTKEIFDSFIEQNGHYVLIGNTKMKNHCDCYNPSTKEGSPDCPKCFGIGWKYKWHATKTRRSQQGQALSSSNDKIDLEVPIKFSGSTYKYYLKTENNIGDLDLIIEFDIPENRNDYNLYIVYNHTSFRGKNGDLVYKGALANRLELSHNHIKKALILLKINQLKEV